MAVIEQKYNDTTLDLLYNLLIQFGGTMADIEQKYNDTGDDLLYAIIKRVEGGFGGSNPVEWEPIAAPGDSVAAIGYIHSIVIRLKNNGTGFDFRIGTTPGGSQLFEGVITPGQNFNIPVQFYSEGPIYFTNNFDAEVKIFKQ